MRSTENASKTCWAIVVTGNLQKPFGQLRQAAQGRHRRDSAGPFFTMLDTERPHPPTVAGRTCRNGPALLRQRGSNHVGLRQFNEARGAAGPAHPAAWPRPRMARVTGLTAQTIGLITARLDEDQLLRREAPVRGRVGQPSVPIVA